MRNDGMNEEDQALAIASNQQFDDVPPINPAMRRSVILDSFNSEKRMHHKLVTAWKGAHLNYLTQRSYLIGIVKGVDGVLGKGMSNRLAKVEVVVEKTNKPTSFGDLLEEHERKAERKKGPMTVFERKQKESLLSSLKEPLRPKFQILLDDEALVKLLKKAKDIRDAEERAKLAELARKKRSRMLRKLPLLNRLRSRRRKV